MASYQDNAMMSQHSPQHPANMVPHYPPPPDGGSPTNAPFPPQLYPNTDPALQPAPLPPSMPQTPNTQNQKTPKSQSQTNGSEGKEYRNRLRKACDSCSVRKVKCDENQPCKACRVLEIPCTFDRPSKRRGPPNRHADAIKKQRLEGPSDMAPPQFSQPSSPTHAAHTLASLAQHQVLSADSIMPWDLLLRLVDDYFDFIHPIIPVPHEQTFRGQLHTREDHNNPSFLALLASMIGVLVANFPRRARVHVRDLNHERTFASSLNLLDRCHKIAMEAQGPVTFYKAYTVEDAITNYLQGIIANNNFHPKVALLYFRECMSICISLGLHKASTGRPSDAAVPRMTPNGQSLAGPQSRYGDYINQELGRRIFWLLFVQTETLRQLGHTPDELSMPHQSKNDPYPPLPLEVDDENITPNAIKPQKEGTVSKLVAFNINTRIYLSGKISTTEQEHDEDEVFGWDRQKKEIEESLAKVKRIIEELPSELKIASESAQDQTAAPQYPSPGHGPSSFQHQSNGVTQSNRNMDKAAVQRQIQQASIYTSQIGTRSTLIEKYLTLDAQQNPATGRDDMNNERSALVRDFLQVLTTIKAVGLEPSGAPQINRLTTIGSHLLFWIQDQDLFVTGSGLRDQIHAQEALHSLLTALKQILDVAPPNYLSNAENDDLHVKPWADFRIAQDRFVQDGGLSSL